MQPFFYFIGGWCWILLFCPLPQWFQLVCVSVSAYFRKTRFSLCRMIPVQLMRVHNLMRMMRARYSTPTVQNLFWSTTNQMNLFRWGDHPSYQHYTLNIHLLNAYKNVIRVNQIVNIRQFYNFFNPKHQKKKKIIINK
jgi:hypothetical protein